MQHELILVLDFGGQYNQLIARRVREQNVYCIVKPYNIDISEVKSLNPKGIIFTGGPKSVTDGDAPKCDSEIFSLGIPILGICYGAQFMAHALGGKVEKADSREYGKVEVNTGICRDSLLLSDISVNTVVWMSHTYFVSEVPDGFKISAVSDNCPCCAMENEDKRFYAVQFHPEVNHTAEGTKMLHNFLYKICRVSGDWQTSSFVKEQIEVLREKIGDKKVLLALSGGVDSSVAAALLSKAVGNRLTCIFVDHGLLRKNEGDEVETTFRSRFDMNIIRVNAKERFLEKLKGITEPEAKRKIIGEEFIRVFEAEAKKLGSVDFLAQGTIYPDVIESGAGDAAVIKSHHNVGALPDCIDFKEIIEPLRNLFKDEVRNAGLELGLPDFLVFRQPFPGPGLAIRIIGEITDARLEILKEADFIFREEIAKNGLDKDINQYFAVLTNMRSVGVMGDERTYDYTLALRGVTTSDFMTADWARIPYDVLEKVSNRIVNEVSHINRIVYDITSKPPGTIEWE